MKPVSALLAQRSNAGLWHTTPDATVFDALHVLAKHEVGALVVMDDQRLVGVFSERDYTRKVALLGKNSKVVQVAEIMTANVITVTPETPTHECMTLMSQKRIRHLPVVQGDKVIGMISIRDLMDDIISDHEQTIEQLTSYIQS
ncbi:MAG: CBS domain-containing protein [Comamonadaceae bacterium]|nr:MAG: CBS domain-containing protein [Comamonadaceae bacterium]